MVAALHAHVGARHHVVAQIVEAKLGVRAIGDVCDVGRALVLKRHAVLEQAHLHAQEVIELAHPLGISTRQIVVHGHHVHALARNGVEIACERGDERLALARLHLRNHAAVQRDAADDLHVEVAHAKDAVGRLSRGSKRLGEQLVERLALFVTLTEQGSLTCQLLVIHLLVGIGEPVDLVGDRSELTKVPVGPDRKNLGEKTWHAAVLCVQPSCSVAVAAKCLDFLTLPNGRARSALKDARTRPASQYAHPRPLRPTP